MVLAARTARTWRARSRAGIALVVLTAWFGTLLVAAPTTQHASADPGSPALVTGPGASGNDATPTWVFTVPADTTSTTTNGPDPVTSDTATVTIASSHHPVCWLSTSTPPDATTTYDACTATGTPTQFSYTPTLATSGSYTLYVHDVDVTTTTTTTYHSDGTTGTAVDGPHETPGADVTFGPYAFDGAGPAMGFDSQPVSPSGVLHPQWTFHTGDAATVTCSLSPSGSVDAACPSPLVATLPGNGTYTLTITGTDAAGNASVLTSTYVATDPAAPAVTTTAPTGNNPTIAWSISGPTAADGYDATLTAPDGTTTTSSLPAGTTSYPATLTSDGRWTLAVTATVDGRTSAAGTSSYDLDTHAPTVTVSAVDATTPSAPAWKATSDDVSAPAQCRLTGTTATGVAFDSGTATCGTTYTAPTLAEGTYTLTVTATDPAGNAAVPAASAPYTYDITKPAAPVLSGGDNGTPGYAITSPIVWNVAVGDTDTTRITCTVTYDDGTSVGTISSTSTCGSTVSASPSAGQQGTWTLTATAYDSVGNASPTATRSVVFDSILNPVDVVANAAPADKPSWHVSVDADATATCSMAGAATPTDCTGKDFAVNLSGKPGGLYTLQVDATDKAGNTRSTTVDYVLAPDAPVVAVAAQGSSRTPAWTITAQSGATLTCRVVDPAGVVGAAAPCTSGYAPTLSGADGTWNLQVVATVGAGASTTSSPAGSATPGYRLDTTAPADPSVTTTATSPQNTSTVHWTVTPAAGDTVRVDCEVWFKPASTGVDALHHVVPSCQTSGVDVTFSSADQGDWQVRAAALDAVGNKSNVVNGPVVTYDSTAPAAPVIVGLASISNNASPMLTINTEPGTTLACAWTAGSAAVSSWTACSAFGGLFPVPPPAADGIYTLHTRATDAAGNTGPEAAQDYELDRTAPAAPTFSTPTSPSSSAAVSWTVTPGGEINATLECRLVQDDGTSTPAPVTGFGWAACTSPYAVTLPTEGSYAAQSRITDAAGNLGPVGTSAYYTYDKTPPQLPTVTGPAVSPSQSRSGTWTFAAAATDGGSTLECRNVDNGTAVGSFVTCTSPYVRSGLADGSYALQVRAVDDAHNATAVVTSSTYTVDNVGPAAPAFAGAAGTGNTKSNAWSFTGETGATPYCLLYLDGAARGAAAKCASGDSFGLTGGDGSYQLEVYFRDAAGNDGVPQKSPAYLLDTKAPATPAVTGPSGPANVTAVSYSFTSEPGSTAECRIAYVAGLSAGSPAPVGAGGWSPCTSAWAVTLAEGDGRYRAEVRVTDAAGNVSPAGQSSIYVLDTTGPLAVSFTAQPTGTANVRTVTWSWTGETPSTGLCTLSRTPVGSTIASVVGTASCDSGTYTSTLNAGDGFYQLAVQLTDPWNNKGAVTASTGYNLDATPPAAPTVDGPTGTSNRTSADYSYRTAIESGATAECLLTLDGSTVQDWSACSLPRTVGLNGDGSYVLSVRLTDQYGNLGAVGSSPAYLLDTKLPTVPQVSAPTSPASSAAPTFTFTTDADTTTSCRLSRGSVVVADAPSCAGAFTASLTGQPDGEYVLEVTAKDPAGNVASGNSTAYVFDTTKPDAPAVTGPAGPSQLRNPVFSWTGEVGARAECSLQEKAGPAGAWTACSAPYAPALPADGSWVLSVRLTDAAGNVSSAGASGAYVFDTTAPSPPVVTAPTSPGRDLAPSWSAAFEEGGRTECRLTGPGQLGAWASCTLPLTTPISGDGSYTLEVRATDAAGNVSAAGAGSYLLDTTAPAAPVVTPPASPGRSRTPSIAFTSEAGTTGSCKLTHGAEILSDSAACSSPATVDLAGLPDGAYTLSVRAVDAAGNIGPAGTATYVLDTTAPAAPIFTLIAGSPSSDHAPSFGFTSEAGSTVSCKVTVPGGTVKDLTCASPVSLDLSNSADGDYVLALRATDAAGNASAAATTTYHLDSTAPAAPKVTGPPTPGSIRNPVWKVSSASPAECRLLRGTAVVRDWTACGTSYAADLFSQPDGVYLLEARVVGTTAATTSRYRLDTTEPPTATITAPPSPSTVRKPTWAVASPDTTVTAECRVMVFTGVLRDWAPCGVSPAGSLFTYDLTGLGDGTYTLVVRLTDGAGNVGQSATSDYVLDTSAPAAVGVLAPPSPGNDTTPTWTLTSATGVKLECRITSGQKVVTDFAPCTGSFTADLTGLPDGTYTLTVHALSSAGTPGPETTSGYMLDTTVPATADSLSGPTGPSRDRAPRWTFTIPSGTTATCKVTVGAKTYRDGACTSPYTLDLSGAADGTYTLAVRFVDGAGNIGPASTANYILKTSPPPAPTLTMQPGSPSSTIDPRWGFSLVHGTTGQCRLLQGGAALEDWGSCTTPKVAMLAGKPDGVYTMQIRAVDAAGNTSSPVGSDYAFDRSAAPLAVFVEVPASPGNDVSPTWTVAAPSAAAASPATTPAGAAALLRTAALTGAPQVECRLTTPRGVGSWAPCSGRYTASTNGDGSYVLEARAYDAAGDRGPASASTYVLDTRAPAAPRFVEPVPPAVGNEAQVAWTWEETGDRAECRLLRNGSALMAFADCTAPQAESIGRFGEATYSLEVRTIDAAGNASPVSTASYRYDVTPPTAPLFVTRPPARGSSGSATWTFTVPVDTSAVCVVSRNGTVVAEGACAGSYALDLRGQQPAAWALSVHLVDAAGNAGPASVGTYALTSAVGRDRVDQLGPRGGVGGSDGPAGPAGPGAGPGTAVPGRPQVPAGPAAVPGANAAADHGHGLARLPEAVKAGTKAVLHALPGIPGAIPGTDVPAAIKNVLGQTITKPQLPLALLVIVLLFLLVQNRIDRRDPKLAAAPVTAEPELTFGPTLRLGGATS